MKINRKSFHYRFGRFFYDKSPMTVFDNEHVQDPESLCAYFWKWLVFPLPVFCVVWGAGVSIVACLGGLWFVLPGFLGVWWLIDPIFTITDKDGLVTSVYEMWALLPSILVGLQLIFWRIAFCQFTNRKILPRFSNPVEAKLSLGQEIVSSWKQKVCPLIEYTGDSY